MSSRPPAAPMRPQSSPALDSELWCAFLIPRWVVDWWWWGGGFPPCEKFRKNLKHQSFQISKFFSTRSVGVPTGLGLALPVRFTVTDISTWTPSGIHRNGIWRGYFDSIFGILLKFGLISHFDVCSLGTGHEVS